MSSIRIKWTDQNSLIDLINKCYFNDGNNGVIRNSSKLKITKGDTNHIILKNLDYSVKVTAPFINGSLKCLKQEEHGDIYLKPMSVYCIKDGDNFSFY